MTLDETLTGEEPLIHPLLTTHQPHPRYPPSSPLQLQIGLFLEVEVLDREEVEFRAPAELPGEYHAENHRKHEAD